jgi:hypothetical protein
MSRCVQVALWAGAWFVAWAGTAGASSIEWVVDQAEFVGVAVFDKPVTRVVPPLITPNGVFRTQPAAEARLRVVETLTGQGRSHVTVPWGGRYAAVGLDGKPREFLVVGGRLLGVTDPWAQSVDGGARREDSVVIWCPLDGSVDLISMRLECHNKREAMIAAVRRALAESPGAGAGSCVIPLPPGLSRVGTVRAPADGRLEALAHQWSASLNLHLRIAAVEALSGLPNERSVALLKRLMASDTGVRYVQSGAGKWQRGRYTVRLLAHQLLRRWGEEVAEPVLDGPALVYAPVRWGVVTLVAAALALPVVAACVVARRRRTPAGAALEHRAAWREARRAGVVSACFVSVAALSLLWARSRQTVDELTAGGFGAHHQLASWGGGLQYVRLADCRVGAGLQYGRFEPRSAEDCWSIPALEPRWLWQRAGLATARGQQGGPDEKQHAYRLIRVPYWSLMAASLLPLAGMLAGAGRRWRRRRAGRCPSCGYDLRASAGACPECGEAVAPRAG